MARIRFYYKKFTIILLFLLIASNNFAQLNPIKKFDYSLLEGKKLYIPMYDVAEKYMKKMAKKGKYDKLKDTKEKAEMYNKAWTEAMAESSYDATDYEIRPFDERKLIKSKDKEAILLVYIIDERTGNITANLMVTSPKRRLIAMTVINTLDLSEKNDIRLMMNMLNQSLNTAIELEDEGDKSRKAIKNKYKENLVNFVNQISEKTFLVPKSTHKKPKKAAERNADLKAALNTWKLSKYKMTDISEIESKRLEGDPDSYYWIDIPYYTANILITYHLNFIVSTDSDEVIYTFLGTKRLKPSTLDKIQDSITKKAAKYREQLGL